MTSPDRYHLTLYLHGEFRHAEGPCSGRDSYGLPCECPSFEIDRAWSGLDGDE